MNTDEDWGLTRIDGTQFAYKSSVGKNRLNIVRAKGSNRYQFSATQFTSMLISRRQAIPLIILLLLSGCYASNSDYKDPKLPENIRLLQMGDSLQKVYATLGSPLWIEINSDLAGNGAYHQETSRQTDLFTVSRITADKNKEVFMIYSQPKNPGKNYILYAVDIREGKVFRKPKPSYQD